MGTVSGPRCHLYRHGGAGTRLYNIWKHMKQRTSNPNDKNYPDYGGRGIRVCDEWVNDFPAFKTWAIANGYTDALSIDRIDVNGNYEPSNCRWIPFSNQGGNKRNCNYLSAFGKTATVAEWSKETGIPAETIRSRINKLGWAAERAVTEGRNK